ncbi:MAG: tetratricopeptide repeat protein [Candidatus Zixiibacteriota bacterium]
MNSFLKLLLLFLIVISVFPADDIKPDSPEGVLHFADHLFQYGEYRRAATEYLRYYSLYFDKEDSDHALFNAAFSLEKSEEYSNARNFYMMLKNKSGNDYKAGLAGYRYAVNHFLDENIDSCLIYIDEYRASESFSHRYLEGFCYLKMREYALAESLYYSLASINAASELSSSVHYLISKSRQGSSLPARNPATAALMSTVIPGLGMGYSERWGDAFFSFMAVAVTIAPAVYFYEEDRTFSITTGLIGLFFYGGNIYGSANAAKKFNEKKHKDFYNSTLEGVPFQPDEINTNFKP